MQTLTGLYDTYDIASRVVGDLEAANIAHGAISIVSNKSGHGLTPAGEEPEMTGTATGATAGAVLTGGAGLLAGLGLLAIPGLGPVVAAGWLASTAVGAAAGGVAGGLLGALADTGIDEKDAHVYAEGIRRGGTLVSVRAQDSEVTVVREILHRNGQVDPVARGSQYRAAGWNGFEETAVASPGNAPLGGPKTWPGAIT